MFQFSFKPLVALFMVTACSAEPAPIESPQVADPQSSVFAPPDVVAVLEPAEVAAPKPASTFTVGTIATSFSATVDGDLSEWTAAPTLTLHAPDGRTTEVWLSASNTGIVLAARGETDALKLELSSPPGVFPVIGFANQFGEEVVNEQTCSSPMADGSARPNPGACHTWLASAIVRHEQLLRWFTRTIIVEGDTVLVQGDPIATTMRRGQGTVEVVLPAHAFPSTDVAPLEALSARLWVAEASADIGPIPFDQPLAFGEHPNLLEAIVRGGGDGDQLRFYQPGPTVDHVAVAFNRPMGYQHEPSEPSPFIGQIGLDRRKVLLRLKGRQLLELPRDFGMTGELPGYAWKNVDGSFTLLPYVSHWGDPAAAVIVRRAGVDLLFGSERTQSPLGTGACGVCPVGVLRVVRVSDDHIEQIVEAHAAPGTGEPVSVTIDPFGRKLSSSFLCAGEVPSTIDLVYDPRTETYERRDKGAVEACAN